MAEEPKKEEVNPVRDALLKERENIVNAVVQTQNLLQGLTNELLMKKGALRYIDEKLKELEPKKEEPKPEPEGAAAKKPPLRFVKE